LKGKTKLQFEGKTEHRVRPIRRIKQVKPISFPGKKAIIVTQNT
jgi:hypothetical protein